MKPDQPPPLQTHADPAAAPRGQRGKLRLVSDLHLFSRRSRADDYLTEIQRAASEADLFVLAGDTFDFKWAHQPCAESFADQAKDWLVDLVERRPTCQFQFLLGNHDHHPALMERLAQLSAELQNFGWDPWYFRQGDAIFLHGDVANGLATPERLARFRARCDRHKRRPGRMKNHLYDAAIVAHVHTCSGGLMFPARRVARRIIRYLENIGQGVEAGTRDVYFGHTHRSLEGYEYGGMRFHNPGAPIRGTRFRILDAEI